MMYILCIVLCFAVGVMLSWHMYGVMWGETSVEAQDHEQYRRRAKERDEEFVNSYHLGCVIAFFSALFVDWTFPWVLMLAYSKWKNLEFFFNIGEGG